MSNILTTDEACAKSEVLIAESGDGLSPTGKFLIGISACLASGKFRLLKALITEARTAGVSGARIYEVLLQSYLFLGYPRALEGLRLFGEVTGGESRSSLPFDFRYWSDWKIRGRVLCEQVYGDNFKKLISRVKEISPELGEWMIVEGYGKVLSRGVLSGAMRELCSVAMLLVTSDINQLHSHMRGAKNLGASRAEISETMQIAAEFCNKQKINRGQKIFNLIFKE